jgi:uncharacterized YkwD family protein/spore coat assembly protein SafA
MMIKRIAALLSVAAVSLAIVSPMVYARPDTYTVKSGDTMWKISLRYEVGLSEIIAANPQIRNPAMIYPGQKLTIPELSAAKQMEYQVIQLTNAQRKKYGLPPLKSNWELSRVARFKSTDMRDQGYFSHESPTYGSPFTMMKNFGIHYSTAAENIAAGQRTAQDVVDSWMKSSGHRANILNRNVTQIGVGWCSGGAYGSYWTQMFIAP